MRSSWGGEYCKWKAEEKEKEEETFKVMEGKGGKGTNQEDQRKEEEKEVEEEEVWGEEVMYGPAEGDHEGGSGISEEDAADRWVICCYDP